MKRILIAACASGALMAFCGAASAADLTEPAYDWTGLYFGGQIGWSWLDPDPQSGLGFPSANFVQPKSNGVIGGGHVGFNYQMSSIVFGLEGDFNGTDLSATDPCFNPAFDCNAGSDWNASIRGRLGFAADRFLVFATGGYAVADYNGYTKLLPAGPKFADSATLDGFAIGGGVEYAWTDNILVRAEYRHDFFGKKTMKYDVPYKVEPDLDMVLVGVSWKF
jgi:outer membrane immunogenic protein